MYGKGPIGGSKGCFKGDGGPIGGGFGGKKGGFGKGDFGKGDGGNMYSGVPGFGKGGRGGFEEEDRSRDWYCPGCRERNFMKRKNCFKCGTVKPKDPDCSAPPRPTAPPNGTTLNGMVKSYNRKGFGFLMCLGSDYSQDIYYTRENLSPNLQTRDIPGEHVTFEIHRFPDGKLTAINIRPLGEDKEDAKRPYAQSFPSRDARGGHGAQDDEDRSRDWECKSCGERNFVKRFECFKCKKPRQGGFADAPRDRDRDDRDRDRGDRDRDRDRGRPADSGPDRPQGRGLSPHAGARAIREALARKRAQGGGGGRSRSRGKRRKRDKSSDSSDDEKSSKSSASRKKGKKEKKEKKKSKRKRSSSSSGSSRSSESSDDCKMEEPAAAAAALRSSGASSEVDKAKAEALEELLKLKKIQEKEARMSEWRALLRKWHPDKNPERTEVATAVFQFLQKGKAILDG